MYAALYQINQTFKDALIGLAAVVNARQVAARQLRPFEEMVHEVRAAVNSFLTSILETRETELAGQLQRRHRQEEN